MTWWQLIAGWFALAAVTAPLVGRWLERAAREQTTPVEERE